MKVDVGPLPERVPVKRRQIEQLADLHIAQWLALPAGELAPSERRRLQEEKARRRALAPERVLGVLVGGEGLTPVQQARLVTAAGAFAGTTEIVMPPVARSLRRQLKPLAPTRLVFAKTFDDAMKTVVIDANIVVAGPKELYEPTVKDEGVWAMVRYAKHRSLPVVVVTPDGEVREG